MGKKKATDLFIEDGEYRAPAIRGAINNWIDRDWTLVGDTESKINYRDDQPKAVVAYREFESWLNKKVEEDWFDEIKREYGNEAPKEIFKEYYENNEEFSNEMDSHMQKVTIGGNPGTNNEQKDNDAEDGEAGGNKEEGQSSFGESNFPELCDVGVVDDNANVNQSKLRGLVVAFIGDIDEIKGESREFDIKAVQRAFLQWGKDRFGQEWIDFVAQEVERNTIYEAVKWVYNNHDDGNMAMHKKFRGNYDIDLGNPDADDVTESFLESEVEGWREEDGEEEQDGYKDKWDEFEERASEETSTPDSNDDGSSVEGSSTSDMAETGVDEPNDAPVDNLQGWADKEGSKDEVERTNRSGDGSSSDDGADDNLDGDADASGSGDDGGNGLDAFAEREGTTDEVHKPSRTRGKGKKDKQKSIDQSDTTYDVSQETTSTYEGVECEDGGRPHEIKWPDIEPIDQFESNKIYEGNTFEWAMKLPENSVDTMVTSPPYYALRDYDIDDAFPISGDHTCDHDWDGEFCTKCGSFIGQLGHEPEPALFIDHIVDLMDRYKRVLKPSGSLWLNIGDTYAGKDFDGRVKANNKSRMMIPERIYRRMVQTGWHLRDYVIWVKKVWMPDDDLKGNGKPFASGSRLADQWEPMVRFTPESDHYSDVDSNRLLPPSFDGDLGSEGIEGKFRAGEDTQRGKTYNELGTNPPDVWLINSDGYQGDHRAVFPEELPKRCINISTPDRVCEICGRPYDKDVKVKDENELSPGGDYAEYTPRCRHDADHEPGVAFDPFLGSGTTAVAAANNGFNWAGVELSEKYQELARERIPTGRQVGLDQW